MTAKNTSQEIGGTASLEDLKAALKAAESATAVIKAKLEQAQEEQRKVVAVQIIKMMDDAGLSVDDIAEALNVQLPQPNEAKAKRKEGKAPLYFNPANPEQKYTGLGRYEPEWIKPFKISDKPRTYREEVHIKNQKK